MLGWIFCEFETVKCDKELVWPSPCSHTCKIAHVAILAQAIWVETTLAFADIGDKLVHVRLDFVGRPGSASWCRDAPLENLALPGQLWWPCGQREIHCCPSLQPLRCHLLHVIGPWGLYIIILLIYVHIKQSISFLYNNL